MKYSVLFFCFAGFVLGQDKVQLLASAVGDLDRDGTAEKVEVVMLPPKKNPQTLEEYAQNELRIFKRDGSSWKLWYKSANPIDSSFISEQGINRYEHFSAYGFKDVKIERGAVVVHHYSEYSNLDWAETLETHRYRFQNGDWYLIGYTKNSKSGSENQSFTQEDAADLNFSTGKGIIKYHSTAADPSKPGKHLDNRTFSIDISGFKNITMSKHRYQSRELKTPDMKQSIVF